MNNLITVNTFLTHCCLCCTCLLTVAIPCFDSFSIICSQNGKRSTIISPSIICSKIAKFSPLQTSKSRSRWVHQTLKQLHNSKLPSTSFLQKTLRKHLYTPIISPPLQLTRIPKKKHNSGAEHRDTAQTIQCPLMRQRISTRPHQIFHCPKMERVIIKALTVYSMSRLCFQRISVLNDSGVRSRRSRDWELIESVVGLDLKGELGALTSKIRAMTAESPNMIIWMNSPETTIACPINLR
jgi:hypothetical protein